MKPHTYTVHGLLVTKLGDTVISVQRTTDGTVAVAPILLSSLAMLVIVCIALARLVRFGPKSMITTRMVVMLVAAAIVFWTRYLGLAAIALAGLAAWLSLQRSGWRAGQ